MCECHSLQTEKGKAGNAVQSKSERLLPGLGDLGGGWGILHQGQDTVLVKLVLLQILAGQLLAAGGLDAGWINGSAIDTHFIVGVGARRASG